MKRGVSAGRQFMGLQSAERNSEPTSRGESRQLSSSKSCTIYCNEFLGFDNDDGCEYGESSR